MTSAQLQDLLERFEQGLTSPAEEQLLMQWANDQEQNELRWSDKERNAFKNIQIKAIQNVTGVDMRQLARNIPQRSIPTRWLAAASVLLMIVGIYYLSNNERRSKQSITASTQTVIPPGNNKAILTLGDGSTIILNEKNQGLVAKQGQSDIIKTEDGRIRYESSAAISSHVVLNTMTTPRGGQYQLSLPDGTMVWLNAESSITFPSSFTGNLRKVSITGEAYLDVKKDKSKPFILETKSEKIEVLGTGFNVNNYPDESISKATLVEGSIKINSYILKPGEQFQTNINTGKTKITKVDTDLTTAWKNGQFNFSDAGIENVMRQLSRWYDVAVEYKGKIPERSFSGKISRNLNLNEIISILNFNDIKAKLYGRKIIIEP